jgi:hypothetical protein
MGGDSVVVDEPSSPVSTPTVSKVLGEKDGRTYGLGRWTGWRTSVVERFGRSRLEAAAVVVWLPGSDASSGTGSTTTREQGEGGIEDGRRRETRGIWLFGSSPLRPLRLPVLLLTWVQHRNTHSTALPLGRHPSDSLFDESPQDSPSPCPSSSSSRPSPSEPLPKPR